jgi:hypothetical protein
VNTIWGFKHKVTERIADLEKKGKRPEASRWEEIILFHEPHETRYRVLEEALPESKK